MTRTAVLALWPPLTSAGRTRKKIDQTIYCKAEEKTSSEIH